MSACDNGWGELLLPAPLCVAGCEAIAEVLMVIESGMLRQTAAKTVPQRLYRARRAFWNVNMGSPVLA
jgi:hypothetical protein